MTPLRQRFVDDLRVRNRSPRTIETYVGVVAQFARHFGRSPELLGPEEVRTYQLHLIERRVSWSKLNQTVCALRFLYGSTMGRPEQVTMIPFGKRPRKLPCVLSPEEVTRLLDAAEPGRERVMLQTTYACGLRLEELLHVQVGDIDSRRMVLQVRQGKGQKDRLVPLSPPPEMPPPEMPPPGNAPPGNAPRKSSRRQGLPNGHAALYHPPKMPPLT